MELDDFNRGLVALIKKIVCKVIGEFDLVPRESLKGKTWDVEDFRKQCLGGKSRAWVKREIFDRYPETNIKNGGFVVDPFPGTGHKTIIYAYDASLWVNEHYREFNWRS